MDSRFSAQRFKLLEGAFSASSIDLHATAWKHWTAFVGAGGHGSLYLDTRARTQEQLMVNARCMADFVAYCSLQRSRRGGFLKASTIRDYCNGVGKAHLRLFGVDPVEPLQLHRKVLEGVRKRDLADGWVPKRKLPFTKGMLLRCATFFNLFNPADLEL